MPETSTLILIGAVVVGLILLVVLVKAMYRIAEPSEALIITGLGARGHNAAGESQDFKIVAGKGTFVIPGLQTVRSLNLRAYGAELSINDPRTVEGLKVSVKANVTFKIGDSHSEIANAARRFLTSQNDMVALVKGTLEGQLRAVVGSMKVQEMLHDREALANKTRETSAPEMEKMGLIIDAFLIQDIGDEDGYIDNLGKPEAARVASEAAIAEANRKRETTEAQQAAEALSAQAERDTSIKRAGYTAETEQAQARAKQAGPLEEAKARQAVIEESTRAAQLEAALTEQRLQTSVVKPADAKREADILAAEAARQTTVLAAEAAKQQAFLVAQATRETGKAEADAAEARGKAEAVTTEANGKAVAASIEARGRALAQNQDAVIRQQFVEIYPEVVRAAASGMSNVGNMVVLDGADGLEGLLTKFITSGGAGVGAAMQIFNSLKSQVQGDATQGSSSTGASASSSKPSGSTIPPSGTVFDREHLIKPFLEERNPESRIPHIKKGREDILRNDPEWPRH